MVIIGYIYYITLIINGIYFFFNKYIFYKNNKYLSWIMLDEIASLL